MTEQLDILLCIIPKVLPDVPTVGPNVLKAHCERAGFSAKVLDLNIKLYNRLKEKEKHREYFFDNDMSFRSDLHKHNEEFEEFYNEYSYIFLEWIEWFKELNPRYIGMSLLSNYSTSVGIKLARLVREHLPDIKIIWGGAAIDRFSKKYHEQGLIDHWVWGDGEDALIQILKGELDNPGIDLNGSTQLQDLNTVMVPDYSDINFEEYDSSVERPVYITGSRGCVKKCTFCNVADIWPTYKFRSGENIAREMIEVSSKYNRKTFKFTDSLINGSMKNFRDALTSVREFKLKSPQELEWTSQWIIRSPRQSPESDYKLMKESGCVGVEIGIESFSQDVRWHMLKKFTDDDMWYCFDMLQKYKIHHAMLMIVGYPTETDADHQRTMDILQEIYDRGYTKTKGDDGKKLIWFSFSNTLMLDPGQPLWNKVQDGLIEYNNEWDWNYKGNTLDIRLERLREVNEKVTEINGQETSWMLKKKLEIIRRKKGVVEEVANIYNERKR